MGEGVAEEGTAGRPRSLGRRIGLGLFWALMIYVVTVGFASVVPQVFWPAATAAARTEVGNDCREGLWKLKAELLEEASRRVRTADSPAAPASRGGFFSDWDDRHLALEPRCGGALGAAHRALGRLRQRLEISLLRVEREQAPLARGIERTLSLSQPE